MCSEMLFPDVERLKKGSIKKIFKEVLFLITVENESTLIYGAVCFK